MIDRSQDAPRQPAPMTLAALMDVLTERYGGAIAAAVIARLRDELAAREHLMTSAVIRRAVTIADAAELAIAGSSFLDPLSLSAVADTPRFRSLARSAGVRPQTLTVEQRLRIDASFARVWRERRRADPRFVGRDAAFATMMETLRATMESCDAPQTQDPDIG